MMDDFLDNYEVLGRKMEPTLAGDTPAEKLAQYRQTLAEGGRIQIRETDDDDNDDDILMPAEVGMGKDRWDCETILSKFWNVKAPSHAY
jgi:protein LTV1